MKNCYKCNKNFEQTSNVQKYCKTCKIDMDRKWSNEYYHKNKDNCNKKMREWRLKNPERKKIIDKQYRLNNREKKRKLDKIYRLNNIEKIRKYQNELCKKNKSWLEPKWKARKYARDHKFRRHYCLLHLLEGKQISSIHFHHTDYEFNLGFSVCMEHHTIADNWVTEGY